MKFYIAFFVRLALLGSLLLLPTALSSALGAQQSEQDQDHDVHVVINETPPYSYLLEDGTPAGLWIDRIAQILSHTNLEYRFSIVPWSRAISQVNNSSNILIAHLDRTPARENNFHWLYRLNQSPFHLIARRGGAYAAMTIEEAVNSDGVAACVHYSSHCDMLRELGFPEDRIWKVADYSGSQLSTLVLNNRAAFWLESFDLVTLELAHYGIKQETFISLGIAKQVSTYLAAHKSFNAANLKKIQDGINALPTVQQSNSNENIVYVASSEVRPYFYQTPNNEIVGEWVPKIRDYLDKAGLESKFHVVPWTRALREAYENNDVLIADIDRTPERENQYEWLLPLYEKQNYLLAHKDSPYGTMTLDQAIASDGFAMCLTNSYDCDVLLEIGFPKERIMELRKMGSEPIGKMLYAGRVAFTLGDPKVIRAQMESYGFDPMEISALSKINDITSYLAAPKNLSPRLMNQLLMADR